jgi:Leucine-rich repeat (LRR) protein
MSRIFKPDPVQIQKGRVLEAITQWRKAFESINNRDDLPPSLLRLVELAGRVADPVHHDVVTSLDALVVEFETLVFVEDPDETMRSVEEKTLLLQAALGNLRRGAARAGYEADEADDASLPPGMRLPRAALADKLEALGKALEDVQAGIASIEEAQRNDRNIDMPRFQAPLVANTIERVTIKVDLSLLKLQGKLIDVSGLARLAGETRKLIGTFLTSVSKLALTASSWLRTEAPARLRPVATALGKAAGAMVTKAVTWLRTRTAPKPEPSTPPPDFDPALVRAMILRGETPPARWAPWITELDLAERDERGAIQRSAFADLTPLAGLSALQRLVLWGTQVADITPLAGLSALQSLGLVNTQVADLTPLAGLSALQSLGLVNTQVVDLTPLAGLSALQTLDLEGTQVADLTPLAGLSALQRLELFGTQVADLTPLAGLSALQTLDLEGTQVADLTPLAGLSALQTLDLGGTQVADLTPLAGLSALQTLDLGGTQVADLTPLAGLSALQRLDLTGTQVADLTPLAGLSALQSLGLGRTQVADLTPLAGLSALQRLVLRGTQVADLAPLRGLPELVRVLVSMGRRAALEATLGREGIVEEF